MARVGRTGVRMLQATTATWSAPPVKWYVSRLMSGAPSTRGVYTPGQGAPEGAGVFIHTADQRYLWVDQGTPPHDIEPRPGGKLETITPPRRRIRVVKGQQVEMDYANREPPRAYLHYQQYYRAKTAPGVLGSGRGDKFGPWVIARKVHHPGIKPRGFSDMVADELQGQLQAVAQSVSKQLAVLLSAVNIPSEKVSFKTAARKAKWPAAPPGDKPWDLAEAIARAANITAGKAPASSRSRRR